MDKVKLALMTGKRNGIIKSFSIDKVNEDIFATAYYPEGEVNMYRDGLKYAVYEPVTARRRSTASMTPSAKPFARC